MPMLVVFDVDGTLTETDALDAEVFAGCFEAVFGVPLPTTRWSDYASPTDAGIAGEAVRRLGLDGRRIPELDDRFVTELERRLRSSGARPIPGARGVFDGLAAAGHVAALATGALERSARLKLAAAGIAIGDRVLVGSDFHPERASILREAIRRTGWTGRAVYVGDAGWDVRAARELALPFVGVDPGGNQALRRAGVRHVVAGYAEVPAFLAALEGAASSGPGRDAKPSLMG